MGQNELSKEQAKAMLKEATKKTEDVMNRWSMYMGCAYSMLLQEGVLAGMDDMETAKCVFRFTADNIEDIDAHMRQVFANNPALAEVFDSALQQNSQNIDEMFN